jgi:hypothetical protein
MNELTTTEQLKLSQMQLEACYKVLAERGMWLWWWSRCGFELDGEYCSGALWAVV